jgi:hypothetical protein
MNTTDLQQQKNGEPKRKAKILGDYYLFHKHPTEADLKWQRDLQQQGLKNKK